MNKFEVFVVLVVSLFLSYQAIATEIGVPVDSGESAYTLAQDYCSDKGGVAHYLPKSNGVVLFSCSDEPQKLLSVL